MIFCREPRYPVFDDYIEPIDTQVMLGLDEDRFTPVLPLKVMGVVQVKLNNSVSV